MPQSHNVSEKPPNVSIPSCSRPDTTCCSTTATSGPASSSPTPSSSAFRTAWWSATAASKPASSSTATGAPRAPRNSPSWTRSPSCATGWRASYRAAGMARTLIPRIALALLTFAGAAAMAAPAPQAQREPELRAAVQHAIEQAECFEDKYDSAVWYKMMEPRLRKRVPDRDERMLILKNVFCEANRRGEVRIPPG